jgi:ribosomal protein L39E
MSKKGLRKKMRLSKESRKIRRIPAFVIVRTRRRVSHNRRNRNWRTDKLRIKD